MVSVDFLSVVIIAAKIPTFFHTAKLFLLFPQISGAVGRNNVPESRSTDKNQEATVFSPEVLGKLDGLPDSS
jgi:hypothetical protein